MTEQPIGVQGRFNAGNLFTGLRQYQAELANATRVQAEFARSAAGETQKVRRTYEGDLGQATKATVEWQQKVGGTTSKIRADFKNTADSVEGSSRKMVRSIALIYAVFRQGPQLAQDFGDALAEAAGGADIRSAFNRLAESVGVNADEMLAAMQRAARGTVEEIELMRVANRAFLAGGREFGEAVPRLFQIARAAAAATGKDLRFVFDTLITGIARSSPKLIDNAEIYLSVGDAVERWAEAQGKSADELTKQEGIIATLNAVLAEGDDVIKAVGTDTELATDAFNRNRASVENWKQSLFETINEGLGPAAAAGREFFTVLNQIAPLLQTLALLRIAGEGSALAALVPILSGIGKIGVTGGGIAAVILLLREIEKAAGTDVSTSFIDQFIDTISNAPTYIEEFAIGLKEGADAADRFAETGLTTSERVDAIASAFQHEVEQLGHNREAYGRYLELLEEANAEIVRTGGVAIPAMTEAQFRFNQVVVGGQGALEDQISALEELRSKFSVLEPVMGKTLDRQIQNEIYHRKVAFAAQQAAEAEAELTAELERQQRFRELAAEGMERRRETLLELTDELREASDKIKELEAEQTAELEEQVRKRQDKLREIEIDALHDREDAYIKFSRAVRDAEIKRQRDIEDENRRHALKLQDIERDHRRRLIEIDEEYNKTVREAAIERDALAILQARERRQEEIREAERDRQEAVEDENISYQERLRNIERAFQDRVDKAKLALQDELRDIERNLQRKLEAERRADQQRLRDQKARIDAEIAAERAKYAELQRQLQQFLATRASLISRSGRRVGFQPRLTPTDETGTRAQSGFSGTVTGPFTVQVEPGVKEFIYASGDLRRQEPILPSGAGRSASSMRAAVSGGVGVGLSGFSQSLMDRVGGQMTDAITQGVMDELAEALEAGLGL